MREGRGRQLTVRRLLWTALVGTFLALAAWTLVRGEATFIVMLALAAACWGAAFGAGNLEKREPLPLAANDNAKPHQARWKVWRWLRRNEVDEEGSALQVAELAGRPLVQLPAARAVKGEFGDQRLQANLRAVFGSQPSETVVAFSRAMATGDSHPHVGKG